jgi:hypothetical protein
VVSLPLKSSSRSRSTDKLYEFAEEVANFGSLTDKMRAAEDSTDATAAKNAAAKWKQARGQTDSSS